jgi:hypothetical protein
MEVTSAAQANKQQATVPDSAYIRWPELMRNSAAVLVHLPQQALTCMVALRKPMPPGIEGSILTGGMACGWRHLQQGHTQGRKHTHASQVRMFMAVPAMPESRSSCAVSKQLHPFQLTGQYSS